MFELPEFLTDCVCPSDCTSPITDCEVEFLQPYLSLCFVARLEHFDRRVHRLDL